MERWMGSRTTRWVIALGAGLVALLVGLTKFHVGAGEAKETPPKSPVATKPKREALRYGGKNFDQWRVEMETELKPEIRADGMTAMAAFGANGYGPEAARTIVELMAGYDLITSNTKDKAVVEAAIEAIRKIDAPALPVLWEAVRGDNEHSCLFAIERFQACFRDGNHPKWHPPVAELLKAARNDDVNVRWMALTLLESVKNKPTSCFPVLLKCLQDKGCRVREEAIARLDEMRLEAVEVMPALRMAIGDSCLYVRYAALRMAKRYGGQAKPVLPELRKRLENRDAPNQSFFPEDEFVMIMDTLIAIGPAAKEALPILRKLREKPPETSTPMAIAGSPDKTYRVIDETIKKIEGK